MPHFFAYVQLATVHWQLVDDERLFFNLIVILWINTLQAVL